MTGKKRGKAVKKSRKGLTQPTGVEEEYKKAPHSFVFNRGQVGKNVSQLILDVRRVMAPYTASHLQARKKNVLKDFVTVAGVLNVTHFQIFTKSDIAVHLKLCRLPRGPTLTFEVNNYTLARDVISSIKRHHMEPKQFLHHPLLVMNGFSGEGMHMKLMATMFQNMFPSINVNKVKLNSIRRCVLLSYDAENETIEYRHYNIRAVPVGASRGVKKIIRAKVPNLANLDDMSEFLAQGGGDMSESEAELDGEHNQVTLPQSLSSRGNIEHGTSAIRLTEIGPRIQLKLVKIEEGICDGSVLYHSYVQKTEAELKIQKEERMKKKQQKALRKRKQEENVTRKKTVKEKQKESSLAGMKRKAEDEGVEDPGNDGQGEWSNEEDDAAYYRKEVGEAPDPELFLKTGKKRFSKKSAVPAKKRKFEKDKMGKGGKFSDKGKDGKQKKTKKPLSDLDKIKRRKTRKLNGPQKRNKSFNKPKNREKKN